ncbi:hypothetical protein A2U01_0088522, partial [Trifolium medium]|nr:hypothetical protein [Trifolium medium]
ERKGMEASGSGGEDCYERRRIRRGEPEMAAMAEINGG